jgi:TMEM175 potassium channel family protein
MGKNRMEAFSDGVLAVIITIMVLEMKVPHGDSLEALKPVLPVFLSYVLSFIYVGIYWNNHHHLLHSTHKVTGGILWANLHLLFWLSLFPFATGWVGENHLASRPTAAYGVVLFMAAIAYYILQCLLIRQQGPDSLLASALGKDWKGKLSPILYLVAIPLALLKSEPDKQHQELGPWIATGIYVFVALMWLVPDRRIERALTKRHDA